MVVRRLAGAASCSTLLWVHGLGESGLCFERALAEPTLAGLAHLVPDLPGYGRSPHPAEPLTLGDTARHLAAWLRWRGPGPVVVVGHSMGGVVATLLAEQDPGVVRAVVDVDGNLSLGDCTFSGQAAAEELGSFVRSGFDRLRDAVFAAALTDAAHRGYHVSLRLADPRSFHRHSLELVELSTGEELALRLRRLPVPAAYVAGSPGGACARSLELLAAAGVETVAVGPSGHWPFVDQPAAFAAALVALLDRSGAGRGARWHSN